MLGIKERRNFMKKYLLLLGFLTWGIKNYCPEFKGQTYSAPRIAQEIPRPTAYDAYTPTEQKIVSDPEVVIIPERSDLRVYKTNVNDEPGYRSSIYDSPAMSK